MTSSAGSGAMVRRVESARMKFYRNPPIILAEEVVRTVPEIRLI